ncbi:MAG: hypothetical protein OEY49_19640, partial [Candidatus Heimdallarchaeota archaeon]|nr:hypothetical protein [Candidatus Heimdallarchaeota archaeon]
MNLDYFLAIFLSVLAVIPGIVLIYQYKRTKINDTLIFAAYFIIGGFVQISNVIASQTNVLIYFQMQYMGFNLTFFLLFIHVIRVKGNIKHFKLQSKFQTLIWNVGILWFMILEIMIVFWKSFPQPQTVEWFSLAVPREDRSIPFPYGAGLKFNDTIVYSSDYDFLGHLFAFY